MSRIDERLEAMQVDTSEMTTEEKFTAATGLTHYDEETAANDWYVPGGAANVVTETEEGGEETPETPVDPTPVDPTPVDPTPVDPTPEPETYTITFMNGEEVVKTVTGETGTDVSAPDVEKEGFEFNGWSLDGENPILPVDTIVDSDLTYVALWIESEEDEGLDDDNELSLLEPEGSYENPSEIEVETENP